MIDLSENLLGKGSAGEPCILPTRSNVAPPSATRNTMRHFGLWVKRRRSRARDQEEVAKGRKVCVAFLE
jgi:hypothetical protein